MTSQYYRGQLLDWLQTRFKDLAESETSRPSRIRLGSLRDKSESRVGRLNSEETDSEFGRDSAESTESTPILNRAGSKRIFTCDERV